MTEQAYHDDQFLDSLPEQPPEEIIRGVTPWKKAILRILWGMGLNMVTIQVWYLDVILPILGLILLFLGCRSLRRENSGFRACWYLTWGQVLLRMISLGIQTTVYAQRLQVAGFLRGLIGVAITLWMAQFLCLGYGFRQTRKKAELAPGGASALGLVIWYGLVTLLALLEYQGFLLSMGMLVAYVLILRNLFRLAGELENAGYGIVTAPARLSDRAAAGLLTLVLIVVSACGYLFADTYPMDWQPIQQQTDAQVRQELAELGFPENVLQDLLAEDILACRGAQEVRVQTEDASVFADSPKAKLHFTTVAVRLPGEEQRWKLVHHFAWTGPMEYIGTEALELTNRENSRDWQYEPGLTGQLLYDRDGQTYGADYSFLGTANYQRDSVFFGHSSGTSRCAAFSWPETGENRRGYLSYVLSGGETGWILNAWIYYTRQTTWVQYPVRTALQFRLETGGMNDKVFQSVINQIIWNPWEDEE